jgi:lambda repressor-like predicted transcriptional regulator
MALAQKHPAIRRTIETELYMTKFPNGLHKEDIKAMIRKKAGSCRALARKSGLDSNAIAVSFSINSPIPKANRAIATCIGIPVWELWPEWYDKHGNRITRSTSKHSAKRPQRHSKKSSRNLTENGGAA